MRPRWAALLVSLAGAILFPTAIWASPMRWEGVSDERLHLGVIVTTATSGALAALVGWQALRTPPERRAARVTQFVAAALLAVIALTGVWLLLHPLQRGAG